MICSDDSPKTFQLTSMSNLPYVVLQPVWAAP